MKNSNNIIKIEVKLCKERIPGAASKGVLAELAARMATSCFLPELDS